MSNDDFAIQLMRESYASYCYFVHKENWIDTQFHTFLANKVQDFVQKDTGNPYDVLVLSCPPQHGKSMTVTETFPSWYIGKYPDKRVIVACYNDEFARKFGRRNKNKIEEYGKFIFGINLSKESDREFEIEGQQGSMITRGILSGITGNPGDLIIIDDPIKTREEADSVTHRNKVWDEWESSIRTRTQAGSKIIVIQTRWHEDDLAGRLAARERNIEVVNIPVEAEENDILGRKPGDALCPEIGKDNKWLESFKESYKDGMRAWNALYQGRPTCAEGNMFKREWWRYYNVLPKHLPLKVISVDATFKDNDDDDFVAIEVWGKVNADFYLIDMIKKRMDFPATVEAIRAINEKHSDRYCILIEDKANGPAIIATLKHEISGIVAYEPKGSKISRANAWTGIAEAGNIYLPHFASFTDEFIEEFASFPNGAHDDLVDSASQFFNKFMYFSADYKEDNRTQFEKELANYRNRVINGRNKRRSY